MQIPNETKSLCTSRMQERLLSMVTPIFGPRNGENKV